jgi:hypothetical protein
MKERALTEAEQERITELVHNGIECLGFVLDLPEDLDDSVAVVRTIRGFVDQIHGGVELPAQYADPAQAAVVLGMLWGDEVHRAFGWEWVYLKDDRGFETWGVVSADRSYVCYPHLILAKKLTHPDSDNTVMLLFNMIGAGNLPESSPGTYMRLS